MAQDWARLCIFCEHLGVYSCLGKLKQTGWQPEHWEADLWQWQPRHLSHSQINCLPVEKNCTHAINI